LPEGGYLKTTMFADHAKRFINLPVHLFRRYIDKTPRKLRQKPLELYTLLQFCPDLPSLQHIYKNLAQHTQSRNMVLRPGMRLPIRSNCNGIFGRPSDSNRYIDGRSYTPLLQSPSVSVRLRRQIVERCKGLDFAFLHNPLVSVWDQGSGKIGIYRKRRKTVDNRKMSDSP